MTAINVKIKTLSPIHINSGQANVNVDAEVIHDRFGMPYMPAKRFKGLLAESAIELQEMGERAGLAVLRDVNLNLLFHQSATNKQVLVEEKIGDCQDIQIVMHNLYIAEPNEYQSMCVAWKSIQAVYPEIINAQDVLQEYTSIRYQTRLENGVAVKGSLHNMRVVNPGVVFQGRLELKGKNAEEYLGFILLAIKNIRNVGLKRNRGFGNVVCHVELIDERNAEVIVKDFLERGKKSA